MVYSEGRRDGLQPESGSVGQYRAGERTRVEAATARLIAALDALEAAVERRREQDRGDELLAAQLHAHGQDRSKLAADLDAQIAHARRLEAANHEIARRLDVAIETIRSVLNSNGH
jgi:hypothetical protein